ncbi:MOSC domain-containing protein [Phytoactinopolyspora alkaliphila]|uniref:MOSC domain-containing protein n=1 Tax=Phytoactinopolyspora alkaliphila TaxID=1783498 RepID=A0A6N9YQJ4_9ACTN|nr:MOSC domain-containing protein [Phytoactinopolyspora alkaliphila]NED97252.1 MOSC domain-containing protein [Phytoactinopolyspora alkaliphila]
MTTHPAGTVSRFMVGPIKGLGLDQPEIVEVGPTGVVGDREFFLVDDQDVLLSVTRTGVLCDRTARYDAASGQLTVNGPEGVDVSGTADLGDELSAGFFGHHDVPGREVLGPWAEYFSDRIGQSVRLVRASRPNGACDVHGLTLLGDESVTAVAAHAGLKLDPRRFRMTMGLAGTPAFAEEGWTEADVSVGTAVIRIGGPIKRCAATTRHPETGQRDIPVLRILKSMRGLQNSELGVGVNLGMYAEVVTPGVVRLGDVVTLDAS